MSFGNLWGNSCIPCLLLIITLRFTFGEKKIGKVLKSFKILSPFCLEESMICLFQTMPSSYSEKSRAKQVNNFKISGKTVFQGQLEKNIFLIFSKNCGEIYLVEIYLILYHRSKSFWSLGGFRFNDIWKKIQNFVSVRNEEILNFKI